MARNYDSPNSSRNSMFLSLTAHDIPESSVINGLTLPVV